jgi:hypothetical protein
VQTDVLTIATRFNLVLARQSNVSFGTDAMFKVSFVIGLVQMGNIIYCVLENAVVFDTLGTVTTIRARKSASVLHVINGGFILSRVLVLINGQLATSSVESARATTCAVFLTFSIVDAKIHIGQGTLWLRTKLSCWILTKGAVINVQLIKCSAAIAPVFLCVTFKGNEALSTVKACDVTTRCAVRFLNIIQLNLTSHPGPVRGTLTFP